VRKTESINLRKNQMNMKEIRIKVTAETAIVLVELANRCNARSKLNDGANSHGAMSVSGFMAMLAEDAAMVIDRPGSWEGSNMRDVFYAHGYDV
jgi:hypothetical protein